MPPVTAHPFRVHILCPTRLAMRNTEISAPANRGMVRNGTLVVQVNNNNSRERIADVAVAISIGREPIDVRPKSGSAHDPGNRDSLADS
jgi:hypothetical protein